LSESIRRIRDGDFTLDLRDNAEGEWSILKSDVRKLTARLAEQSAVLQSEKDALRDALTNISHQLKTPLTSLSIMAELLEDENLPPERRREFVAGLKIGLSHMEWLSLALLKMAKLDAGAVEFRREPIYTRALIAQSVENLKILLDVRGQSVTVGDGGAVIIDCDAQWTAEALTNIIKNAAEQSPEKCAIRVSYGENPLCAWIAVTDSGGGISKEDMPHLFRRFYKSGKQGGFGIGLPLSLAIMRGQNGDIDAENVNDGAVFTLKFFR
jgi:signal transduction histidine kinase